MSSQRVHANFGDQVMQQCIFVLVAGLKYPTLATWTGVVYSLGRVMYAVGYMASTKGRVPGFLLCLLSLLVAFVASVMSIYSLLP